MFVVLSSYDFYDSHYSLDKSKELTDEIRIAMARAVHPTLQQLLDLHGEKGVLPSHCFVYGIHLSRTHLSIFVHFPTCDTIRNGTRRWNFNQVLLARHLITAEHHGENSHEELLLYRWRLTISLLTLLKHVRLLNEELCHLSTPLTSPCSVHRDSRVKYVHPVHRSIFANT